MVVRILLILSMSLLLISCEEQSKECPDDFKNGYQQAQNLFKQVYKQSATETEYQRLVNHLNDFIANYSDLECNWNDETSSAVKEMQAFLSTQSKTSFSPATKINKVIYGDDNRLDFGDTTDQFKEWSKAVAAMVPNTNFTSQFALDEETLGESLALCSNQRFYNQINPAVCTGFLIAPDILVTAGHCISEASECSNHKWVFGFTDESNQLTSNQVYTCTDVIKQELVDLGNDSGPDYAVLRLDRPVVGATPLKYRSFGKVSDNSDLMVIGHPSGLPMKTSDAGQVRSNSNESYFVTNLDTFGGNSGSPVIDIETGTVEGILVRGETDYVWGVDTDGDTCRKVKECAEDQCRGEDVTRMTVVQGVPSQQDTIDSNYIFDGIFGNSFSMIFENQMNFRATTFKEHIIAGLSFLNICGMHIREDDSAIWDFSLVTTCSSFEEQLKTTYCTSENPLINCM